MNNCYWCLVLLLSFNSLIAQTTTNSVITPNIPPALESKQVVLKKFTSSLTNQKAVIQWQTGEDNEPDYFEIFHSANGKDFSSIARIKGSGTLTADQSYTFEHEMLSSGKHYYRLVQIDKNGNKHASQIIALSSLSSSRLQLYPNPATDHITVSTSTLLNGSSYSINSITGQALLQGMFTDQHLNVQNLQPGQYWITVKTLNGDLLRANFLKR